MTKEEFEYLKDDILSKVNSMLPNYMSGDNLFDLAYVFAHVSSSLLIASSDIPLDDLTQLVEDGLRHRMAQAGVDGQFAELLSEEDKYKASHSITKRK